jgi:Phospholipid methyltransferase
MRWRVRTGYPVAVIYLVLADPKPRWILIGAVVAAIGLLIRGASAGHLRKDRELATSGPYAYTRNPLYLGSAFLAAGFAIAGGSWWAGLLVVAYFGIFYYAVMRNEEQDLQRRFGADFDAYAARVPLFFPWHFFLSLMGAGAKSSGSAGGQPFSWAQYRRNREYRALIGTIAGVGVLFLRMWIRRRFGY